MICSSVALSLYCSRNASAPEKAIWLIYFSTSASVIPIPLSVNVMVLSLALVVTSIRYGSSGSSNSPMRDSFLSFVTASQPFDISSLTNISWSEYSHFLMTGKMFSLLIDKFPFFIIVYISLKYNGFQ